MSLGQPRLKFLVRLRWRCHVPSPLVHCEDSRQTSALRLLTYPDPRPQKGKGERRVVLLGVSGKRRGKSGWDLLRHTHTHARVSTLRSRVRTGVGYRRDRRTCGQVWYYVTDVHTLKSSQRKPRGSTRRNGKTLLEYKKRSGTKHQPFFV